LHNLYKNKHNSYGILYVVATPIGNINDITYRAVEVLSKVDLIATEDTRHSKKLLNFYGIKTRQISYHKHNESKRSDYLIDFIINGKNVALVSDAGTPTISDPGDKLIEMALKNNISVSPIPGACSVISALCVSGYGSRDFKFIGFLPKRKSQKTNILSSHKNKDYSLVFLESPNRVIDTLEVLKKIYTGGSNLIIAREITKIYEDINMLNIDDWLSYYELDNNEKLKGEFVFIVPKTENSVKDIEYSEIEDFIKLLLKNNISYNVAVKITCMHYDIKKNAIYNKYINLAKK